MTNRKSLLGGLIIILLLGIVFYLVVIGYFAGAKPICAVCQRPLHKAVSFTLQSSKGRTMSTCCPRCGLRYVVDGNASPLWATDFSNGKAIPAKEAILPGRITDYGMLRHANPQRGTRHRLRNAL